MHHRRSGERRERQRLGGHARRRGGPAREQCQRLHVGRDVDRVAGDRRVDHLVEPVDRGDERVDDHGVELERAVACAA